MEKIIEKHLQTLKKWIVIIEFSFNLHQILVGSAKIRCRVPIFGPALSGYGVFSKTQHKMAP